MKLRENWRTSVSRGKLERIQITPTDGWVRRPDAKKLTVSGRRQRTHGENMDIILDSNIYLTDIHLQSNKFANFFDYVRRTGSSVILTDQVRVETVHTIIQKLTACVTTLDQTL